MKTTDILRYNFFIKYTGYLVVCFFMFKGT